MFDLRTRIEAHCRVAGDQIVIEQDDKLLRVTETNTRGFVAINWAARNSSQSFWGTLCTEMNFIEGDAATKV
ncbi:MAG: hypothetical protein ACI9JR_002174 [Gammaproteobacteria bacterium]|jgi:hypothetical protein